jgi:carboxypeptidase Taq
MDEKLNELMSIIYEISDINKTSAVLSWDQETYMPRGGINDRANQLATLSKISHQKFISEEVGKLIARAKIDVQKEAPDSNGSRLIKVLDRNYQKSVKVPSRLVLKMAKASSLGQQAWARAREQLDFSLFEPHLEKIVELYREYAMIFKPYNHIYDALLDDFEPGLKTADVKLIFEKLRPQQIELVKKIKDKAEIDDSFLFLKYDGQKQWDFGVDVISKFGYDWNRGRQDRSTHPLTIDFGMNDVRITTRINTKYLPTGLFGSMHEAGHAMYEQGIPLNLARTPLGGGASLAIHESQSRMWENLVGRSMPFWEYFYPVLQKTFPNQLGNIKLFDFYKGINKVKPSLIRVEADEATYNMHIMLRLEIEIALIEGSIEVKDLPEIWNTKMKEYLGITPKNDAEGVLQDIHWSMGAIGYFSTYAIGNLVSAQLWECINSDIPSLSNQIRKGDFSELLSWLRKNVHLHGAKFEPQELVQRITGSKITPEPYIKYLNNKYSVIYDL